MSTCGRPSTASGRRYGQAEQIYVVNARGDYLVHPDPAREFGSQLGNPANWRTDFPDLASSLGATQSVAQIVPDQSGHPGAVALAPAVLAGSEWVAVIETVSNAVFMGPAVAIRNTSLLVGLIAVLCAAALAVLVARSLTRPISQLTAAVEGLGRNDPVPIPVDAGGETGVLARAFASVMGETNAKTAALEREVEEHRRTTASRDHYAERERLFSAAVESSNDAIITKSLDGTITGWNPAAERLFGFTSAEAVGKEASTSSFPRRPVGRDARYSGPGRPRRKDRTPRNRCDCARTAARSRFCLAYLRSGRRQVRLSGPPRRPAT